MISAFELPYRAIRSLGSAIWWYLKNGARIGSGVLIKRSNLGKGVRVGMLSTIINSRVGDHSRIGKLNEIYNSVIGMYSYTGSNTKIFNCKIGNYVSISWNVTIGPPAHKIDCFTTHTFPYDPIWGVIQNESYNQFSEPCEIGHDVWIGANAIILRGLKLVLVL